MRLPVRNAACLFYDAAALKFVACLLSTFCLRLMVGGFVHPLDLNKVAASLRMSFFNSVQSYTERRPIVILYTKHFAMLASSSYVFREDTKERCFCIVVINLSPNEISNRSFICLQLKKLLLWYGKWKKRLQQTTWRHRSRNETRRGNKTTLAWELTVAQIRRLAILTFAD